MDKQESTDASQDTEEGGGMPRVPSRKRKAPPAGFDAIQPTLTEFQNKLRDAETETHEGKRRVELLWPILRLHHQRTRYIYDLYYRRQAISKEVYEYVVREKLADARLMGEWRKQGYEKLCCLQCIQPKETQHGTVCVCRIPRARLDEARQVVECVLYSI